MRIDGLSNAAGIRANVSDLLGRLDAGDVVKAKVLEITSSDAVLRLFDGSVVKAAIPEGFQAEAGQSLLLKVTSKNEGTLYLETVKGQSQFAAVKADLVKAMLEALQIKPTQANMELAAEFTKSGISVTSEQFSQASAMMNTFQGLNAEKAVFLLSKGIQLNQSQLELLSQLLDGDLKLGNQLKTLQTALENAGGPADSTGTMSVTKKSDPGSMSATASGIPENAVSNPSGSQASARSSANSAGEWISSDTAAGGETATPNSSAATARNSGSVEPDRMDSDILPSDTQAERSRGNIQNARSNGQTSVQTSEPEDAVYISRSDTPNIGKSTGANSPGTKPAYAEDLGKSVSIKNGAAEEEFLLKGSANDQGDQGSDILPDRAQAGRDKPNAGIREQLSSLKETVKELFIELSSDELASELDVSKLHKELTDKLDHIKSSMQSLGLSGGEAVVSAASALDSTTGLMQQLHNQNILYYQLPVNIQGYSTTTELYVMKRQKGRKRIDPGNTVLFVALDTSHIGRVETLLEVQGRSVIVNFRTQNKNINHFIKDNINFLYNGLADCGYKLADIRYALIDSATPPLKIEKLLSEVSESKRGKVDMRI